MGSCLGRERTNRPPANCTVTVIQQLPSPSGRHSSYKLDKRNRVGVVRPDFTQCLTTPPPSYTAGHCYLPSAPRKPDFTTFSVGDDGRASTSSFECFI